MKIMTVVGTRPEVIRLSETIKKLDKHVNHILVHTGQNYDYELNEVFFKDLGLRKPDYFLGVAGDTVGETIANVISKSEDVFKKEQPDAVLILGDTNSALSAIVAKRLKIPIFHLEAGNRCFDERVPEEINRKIVDAIADINVVYTPLQRDYLVQEGKPMDRIFISGSPMQEVLDKLYCEDSTVLEQYKLDKGKYFVVSYHREENTDKHKIQDFGNTILELEKKYNLPIIISTHPRTRKVLEENHILQIASDNIRFCKPFGLKDYIKLQKNALCVISDSGTVAEESSILGFRAVTIRDAIERPEAMNNGSILMCNLNNLLEVVDITINRDNYVNDVFDYYDDNFSDKILNLILSYTDYVNRRVWYK